MRYTIQTKILAGFILGLMAIGLIGYEVHNQMSDLASSLFQKNNRQNNLVIYQKLLSTLSDAESSVRTFSITSNEEDLKLFQTSKSNLEHYLAKLEADLEGKEEYTNLRQYIDYKVHLMNRMIDLKKRHPTDNILEDALSEISRLEQIRQRDKEKSTEQDTPDNDKGTTSEEEEILADSNETPAEKDSKDSTQELNLEEEEKERKGFFQRLFSRRDKGSDYAEEHPSEEESIAQQENKDTTEEFSQNEDSSHSSSPAKDTIVVQPKQSKKSAASVAGDFFITKSIEKLRKEKTQEAEIWKKAMLILIQEDTRIMEEIRLNIVKLEKAELDNNSHFVAVAARSKDQIISNTKMVAIGAFTIIFILSIVVLNDFSKIRKNRQSLIEEKDNANHHARVKEEFLANMSHEIRTPMNAIIGYSELLEKTELDKTQQEFLSTIQQSSSHLLVILNDILDYSKLESGKLTIKEEPFQPVTSIEQVVKSMANEANKKEVNINVTIDPAIESDLIGDSIRFQQILYNLLSNAIKFTDKGEVKITAEGKKTGESYQLKVTVEDEGIGINKEYLDKIFENFEQANTGRERKHGGTGLGLAIVKRLIELQKGTIHVESEENKGSVFTFTIPYVIGEKTQGAMEIQKIETKNMVDFTELSILAVDDQEYNLELIKLILEKWGAKVQLATSGKEAVERFTENAFDLILMDVQMPEMSGLEATDIIRNSGLRNGKNIPIIALTAASTKEETDRCLKSGMSTYLLKPFRQKQLKSIINEQLSEKKKSTHHDIPEHLNEVTYNLEHLRNLASGNDSFVKNMLDVFIKNTRHDLRQLESFCEKKNWKSAGYQAHKMVAPTRHLGIRKLAELLEDIENKGINERDVERLPALVSETKIIARAAIYLLEQEMLKLNNEIKQAS